MTDHGPGPHPLIGRQRRLVDALWAAVAVTFVVAVVGLVAAGRVGEVAAALFVGALVVVPLARLVWLLVRWVRRGDPRFAGAAVALLAVVGVAAASPWW